MSRKRRERTRDQAIPGPASSTGARDDAPFTRQGAIFGALGLATVVAGFVFLAQGSISIAPVLLVIGFLVFFPLALVK